VQSETSIDSLPSKRENKMETARLLGPSELTWW